MPSGTSGVLPISHTGPGAAADASGPGRDPLQGRQCSSMVLTGSCRRYRGSRCSPRPPDGPEENHGRDLGPGTAWLVPPGALLWLTIPGAARLGPGPFSDAAQASQQVLSGPDINYSHRRGKRQQ